MQLLLAGQVVMLVALVAVSAWGWKEVPSEARIRARAGATGMDFTVGKTTALVATPLIGLMVVAATASSDDVTLEWLGLGLLVFLVLTHRSSLRRAAR